MALIKGKRGEIPSDAIMLTKQEALKYQTSVMDGWKHPWDVLAYKYGPVVLAGAAGVSGAFINTYYRNKLKVRSFGKITSYLPIVFIPAVMSGLFHAEYVTTGVILQNECPLCLEMRASALQSAVGVILPCALAPLSAFGIATQYGTYDVPYVTKDPRKVFALWMKMTRPIGSLLFAIFVGHALLASAATYLEAKSISTVNRKLAILEYSLEHGEQQL